MFVILGCVTVVLGFATLYVLPDTPMKCSFLSDAEKTALLQHVSENQTGVLNRHFKASHLMEAAKDVQLWLLSLMTVLVCSQSRINFTGVWKA